MAQVKIIPAPRTPVGEPTDADRERAATRLSIAQGRHVWPGSFAASELAREYAQARLEGYEQAQREAQAVTA